MSGHVVRHGSISGSAVLYVRDRAGKEKVGLIACVKRKALSNRVGDRSSSLSLSLCERSERLFSFSPFLFRKTKRSCAPRASEESHALEMPGSSGVSSILLHCSGGVPCKRLRREEEDTVQRGMSAQ